MANKQTPENLAIEMLVSGWRRNLQAVEELFSEVPADRLTHQPGGVNNHPAWTLCHLMHYHPAILSAIQGQAIQDPANHPDAARFDAGSIPADDPAVYPEKNELLNAYRQTHARIAQQLGTASASTLARPPGLARWAEVFNTTAELLVYLMLHHEATHLGQVVAWRRASQTTAR